MTNTNRVILHCDADNFFASVECSLNPLLKDKYVVVCGDPNLRHGIVLAKNQKAKLMGIKTGDTIWQAKLKCPDLTVVPARHEEYVNYSNILFDIYTKYTDKVECFGLDECWLDVTHSRILGNGLEIAEKIRKEVKNRLNITISVGISFNKIFAKLGSDVNKPDGVCEITQENFKDIIFNKPAEDLLMIGKKTILTLHKLNIHTIGDIANYDPKLLKAHFGINGLKLHQWANGLDSSNVSYYYDKTLPKSISNSTTTYRDLLNRDDATCVIRSLCELIGIRLLKYNYLATKIHLYIKYSSFETKAKQMTIPPTLSPISLASHANNILDQIYIKDKPIRSIGVSTSNFQTSDCVQLNVFDKDYEKNYNLEKAIASIKCKYGYKHITPASLLNEKSFIVEHSNFISNMSNL